MTHPCAHCEDTEGDPLCESCRTTVVNALRLAPLLYAKGSQQLGTRGRALSERVSSSRVGSTSPLRDDLLEVCDDLARALIEWELTTVGMQAEHVRTGYAVQRASLALGNNLAAALATWRGTSHARRVVRRVARLRHALGDTPLVHQLAAPCPQCDTRALIRRDGSENVECRLCGASWPESRYELLVRALVAHNERDGER